MPRGPIVKDDSQLAASLEALGALAKERKAIFLKVDPEIDPEIAEGPLRRAGFRRGPDVQPVLATLELDLGPDEDALLGHLDKDTRWSVRQAEKRGVLVRDIAGDADLRAFYDLYAETGRRARFVTRPWEYYRRMWGEIVAAGHGRVRLAEKDGQAVAGALCWRCGEREVYQTAATNLAGRNSHAAYALLWRCRRGAPARAGSISAGSPSMSRERTIRCTGHTFSSAALGAASGDSSERMTPCRAWSSTVPIPRSSPRISRRCVSWTTSAREARPASSRGEDRGS